MRRRGRAADRSRHGVMCGKEFGAAERSRRGGVVEDAGVAFSRGETICLLLMMKRQPPSIGGEVDEGIGCRRGSPETAKLSRISHSNRLSGVAVKLLLVLDVKTLAPEGFVVESRNSRVSPCSRDDELVVVVVVAVDVESPAPEPRAHVCL